jgi:5-methyltetrahydropteroyltriglutamate--homocysteine methyltransferase
LKRVNFYLAWISERTSRNHSFAIQGAANIEPDAIVIPLEDGRTRQLPRLTAGPFRYVTYAAKYLTAA